MKHLKDYKSLCIDSSPSPDLVLKAAIVGRVFQRLQQTAVISHLDGQSGDKANVW